jgi:transglutaminase-like putative cysteine protease
MADTKNFLESEMLTSKNSTGFKRLLSMLAVVLLTFIYAKNIFGVAYPPKARIVEFTYEIQVPGVRSNTKDIKVWIPAPSKDPYQDVTLETRYPFVSPEIGRDKIFHNKILYYSFESPKSDIRVNLGYKVRRYERSGGLSRRGRLNHEKKEGLAKYLASNRLMVVSEEIKELAAQIVQGKTAAIEKARAIYDYCLTNLSYDKSIPGWGNGDTIRACSVKAGNCTDFHSLFVSLARASGIPAKFVIGFSVPKQ